MEYKIRLLQTCPSGFAGEEFTADEFRKTFPTVVNIHNSDQFLFNYLQNGYKEEYTSVDCSKWFALIPINNKVKVGDWTWNESLKKAFLVVDNYLNFEPNQINLDSLNSNWGTWYKRFATDSEIQEAKLYKVKTRNDTQLLVGRTDCYCFERAWIKLESIRPVIQNYLNVQVLTNKLTWKFNGIKTGSIILEHDEVLRIAALIDVTAFYIVDYNV